jgi:hypothetical protein
MTVHSAQAGEGHVCRTATHSHRKAATLEWRVRNASLSITPAANILLRDKLIKLPPLPMSEKFIPEKIRDFLTERSGRRYCDTCIQERLGLRWRQQVQLVTATLGVTQTFVREHGSCCTCHQDKQVISSVEPRGERESAASQSTTGEVRRPRARLRNGDKLGLVAQRVRL